MFGRWLHTPRAAHAKHSVAVHPKDIKLSFIPINSQHSRPAQQTLQWGGSAWLPAGRGYLSTVNKGPFARAYRERSLFYSKPTIIDIGRHPPHHHIYPSPSVQYRERERASSGALTHSVSLTLAAELPQHLHCAHASQLWGPPGVAFDIFSVTLSGSLFSDCLTPISRGTH